MSDLCEVLPHMKKEVKLDTKDNRDVINEVAELKGCTSAVFFEVCAVAFCCTPPMSGRVPASSSTGPYAGGSPTVTAWGGGVQTRKHKDLYIWMSKTPNGPSIKFHVANVHTLAELKLTGNHLKGSRPVLSFDAEFDSMPHLQVTIHTRSTQQPPTLSCPSSLRVPGRNSCNALIASVAVASKVGLRLYVAGGWASARSRRPVGDARGAGEKRRS
jgi:hypothetical protein